MKWNAVAIFAVLLASFAFAGDYPVTPVTYTALAASTYRLASSPGDVACAPSASGDWSYQDAKLIEIKATNGEEIFGGAGDVMAGDYYFSKVLFDPIGRTNNANPETLNGTYSQTNNTALWRPRVFYMVPGRDCYNWDFLSYNSPSVLYSQMIGIPAVNTPSTESRGGLWFSGAPLPGLPSGVQRIFFFEYAGEVGSGSGAYDISVILFQADNPSYSTHRFLQNTVYYDGLFATAAAYEPVLVTERGSRWLSVDTTTVSALFAKEIAEPEFSFGQAGASTSDPHRFYTLVTDTVDRTPKNRQNTLTEDRWPASLSDPDTTAPTSPLRAVNPGSQQAKLLYRIGPNEFAPFTEYSIGISPGTMLAGQQSFWVGSTSNAVAYDSASNIRDVDVNRLSAMAYSLKFVNFDAPVSAGNAGIPVCIGELNSSQPDNWASCPAMSNDRTDANRVQVKFMDNDWRITELKQANSSLSSSVAAINGGQIKLARESAYGIINPGQSITDGNFVIRLDNVTSGGTGPNLAVFSIMRNGTVVGQVQIEERSTYTFTQSGSGNSVKIHLYRAAPGFTLNATWAEVATFAEEITLKDGSRYNFVSSTHPDKDFKVSLLWKNRDYGTVGTSTVPDSLREIIVYNIDGLSDRLLKGQSRSFMVSNPTYLLKFPGINAVASTGNGTGLPDYVPGGSEYLEQYEINTPLPATIFTRNIGADAQAWSLSRILLQPGEAYNVDVPPLASGGEHSATMNITCTQLGQFNLSFQVDVENQIAESIEHNNIYVGHAQCVPSGTTSTSLEALPLSTYRAAVSPGDVACGASPSQDWVFDAKMVEIQVQPPMVLGGADDQLSGNYVFQSVLLDPLSPATQAPTAKAAKEEPKRTVSISPKFFWKVDGRDCYNWNYAPNNWDTVRFDAAGTRVTPGSIKFAYNTGPGSLVGYLIIKEVYAGTQRAYLGVPVYQGAGSNSVRFKSGEQGKVHYLVHGQTSWSVYNVPPAFTTQRGITVPEVGYSSVPFSIGPAGGSNNTTECAGYAMVNVGQLLDGGNYKVRLADISQPSSNGARNAIIDILDANDAVVAQAMVAPNQAYIYAAPGGQNFAVSVCKVVLTPDLAQKYAMIKAGTTTLPGNNPCPGYSTVNVGQVLDRGTFRLKLDDLVYPDPAALYPANLRVMDANDVTLQAGIIVGPGQSYTYTQPGTSNSMRIEVCRTALGATLNAKWAQLKGTMLNSNNTTVTCTKPQPIADIDCKSDDRSARVVADSYIDEKGCRHVCKPVTECKEAQKPECKKGEEIYSYKDESGCEVLGCRAVKLDLPPSPPAVANNSTGGYTLTVRALPSNGGVVSGGGSNIPSGTVRTVSATANAGYRFNFWNSNCPVANTYSATTQATISYNCFADAYFNGSGANNTSYSISLTASPSSGGSTTGSASGLAYGSIRPIVATAASGYQFSRWAAGTGNCPLANANAINTTITVTPSSGLVCGATALFVQKTCPDVKEEACAKGYEMYKYEDELGCTQYTCVIEGSAVKEETEAEYSAEDSITASMADTSGDLYAKVMGTLGVYVQEYQK